jgi:hypothetical protein
MRLNVVEGEIGHQQHPWLPLTPMLRLELVQSEDRFSAVRDAMRKLAKLDFDKLISSVCHVSRMRLAFDRHRWGCSSRLAK